VPEPKIKGKKLNVPLSFTPQKGETVAEKWRFIFGRVFGAFRLAVLASAGQKTRGFLFLGWGRNFRVSFYAPPKNKNRSGFCPAARSGEK